jgi:hypothetical protein
MPSVTNLTSEDYSSIFQTTSPAHSEEVAEQTTPDTREHFQVYMKEEIVEPPKEEVKAPLQKEFSPPSPHFSPRFESPKVAGSPKQPKSSSEGLSNGFGRPAKEVQASPRELDEPVQEGVKVAPRQYSQEFQQSRVPMSPKPSTQEVEVPVKGEAKATPRYTPSPTPSQKSGILAKALAKITDEPPRDQVKPAPSVVSIDEKFEKISQPTKEVKPSTIEIKDTPNASQTTTEAEDMWTPPKTFKMKKGKKTFSTRY